MRELVTFQDATKSELRGLLDLATRFKRGEKIDLGGKIVALYFMNPSLRTRASMESACARLGAKAIVLDAGAGGVWGLEHRDGVKMDGTAAEHIREAAPVLGRYAHAICVRAFPKLESWDDDKREPVLRAFSRHAGVPVVSLEGSSRHPLQALADALTLQEKLEETRGKKFVLTWAPHPKPLPMCVPNSAVEAAALAGMDVVVAAPRGWELDPDVLNGARALGARVETTTDQRAALEGASAVYAKSWGALSYYGRWDEEKKAREAHSNWMLDPARLGKALFLHCLPVRRDVEVAASILDGPQSVVVDEAENRLWTGMAVLATLLRPTEGGLPPLPPGQEYA